MAKDVTLADIAAKVGVSNVAVSKALSGKPGVSEELRKQIKEIAAQMGYVSSALARPNTNETGNIGVVIPEGTYGDAISFYGRLYEKVVRALYENNYFGIADKRKRNRGRPAEGHAGRKSRRPDFCRAA